MALFNKSARLGALGRADEEMAVSGELDRRFGESVRPLARQLAARALFGKGIVLESVGRFGYAASTCGELVRRYRHATEPALAELVRLAESRRLTSQQVI